MSHKSPTKPIFTYASAALQVITHKKLQAKIKSTLRQYNLNTTQWIILGRLHDKREGLRTTDLAKFLQVEVPLVTMVSQSLISRGLIDSIVQAKDRRTKVLSLTDSAYEMLDTIEKRLQKQFEDIMQDVSKAELQAYYKVLRSMMVHA